jgi:hypothetical protein
LLDSLRRDCFTAQRKKAPISPDGEPLSSGRLTSIIWCIRSILLSEPIPKVVESVESFVIRSAAPESLTGGAEMWKPEHRRAAERHGLRYPSDLTDGEWALVDPMIPPAKRGGHGREVNVREVLRRFFSFIRCIFADAESKRAASIAKTGTWKLTIVQRDELQRFTFA